MIERGGVTGPASRLIWCSALFALGLLVFELVFLDEGEGIRSLIRIFSRDGIAKAAVAAAAFAISLLVSFLFFVAACRLREQRSCR